MSLRKRVERLEVLHENLSYNHHRLIRMRKTWATPGLHGDTYTITTSEHAYLPPWLVEQMRQEGWREL